MTTEELHIGVNLGLQKVASNINEEFFPEEVDYFLNEAVIAFIDEQYSLMKNEQRDIQGQYVNENLRTLIDITELNSSSSSPYYINTRRFNLPSSYLYYLSAMMDGEANIRLIEPKGVKRYVSTEFNDPIFREYPLLLQDNYATVFYSTHLQLTGVKTLTLTYISKPNKINYNSNRNAELQLPEFTHSTIVDMAVNKMLTVIQGRRGEDGR